MFEPETREVTKTMFAKKATTFVELKREEGRREERLATARKMKAKGMSIQLITEITELSEKEILEL